MEALLGADLPRGYSSFIRGIHRGAILCQVLWLVVTGLTVAALLFPGYRYLAVAGFILTVVLLLGRDHVRKRYVLGCMVARDPQLVYWMHPIDRNGLISNQSIDDCKLAMLHLRNGLHLELDLQPQDMRDFSVWLKERNLSVRWGSYDAVAETALDRS